MYGISQEWSLILVGLCVEGVCNTSFTAFSFCLLRHFPLGGLCSQALLYPNKYSYYTSQLVYKYTEFYGALLYYVTECGLCFRISVICIYSI